MCVVRSVVRCVFVMWDVLVVGCCFGVDCSLVVGC